MESPLNFDQVRVVLRGGGDLASGVAYRLHRAGFPSLILELETPLFVRRSVSFGSAILQGTVTVEGITACHANSVTEALEIQVRRQIPVLIDPEGDSIEAYRPSVLVDARMLKAAPDSPRLQTGLTIGLGPGFVAPKHCDAVIETNRGHHLGRVIWQGAAEADTSMPEQVLGQEFPRVLRAPVDGKVSSLASIGDILEAGEPIMRVGDHLITAPFRGVVRGLIANGLNVPAGTKIGDIDPRSNPSYAFEISDKSLAVGGGVLEAILSSPIPFSERSLNETR